MTRTAPPWPGVTTDWIIHADDGARFGAALRVALPPGAGYPVHRHAAVERVVYVLSGSGVHEGAGGAQPLAADDVLVLPPGAWHGLRATGAEPARVLILYTPVTAFPVDDHEVAEAGRDTTAGPPPIRHRLHDVPGRPDVATPERGFDGFEVNWDGAAGATATVLGFARFPPGGTHRWHRHTRADEGGIVLTGNMYHCYDDDGRLPIAAGDAVFMPAGQWHTVDTDPRCPLVDTVWWYLGATTLDGSGYELRESATAGA